MEIGIGLGITRFPGWGVMNIGQLFASGEQGAWYDPSDMSTLFQDSAGTTPVTAVEQPVGRMLDKSGRGNHATQSTTTKRPVLSRRVNMLTKTEDHLDAAWLKTSATITPNAAVAPDGTNTASLLVPASAAGARYIARNGLANSISFFTLKAQGLQYASFGNAAGNATINLNTGALNRTSNGGMTFTAIALGDGWYRVYCVNPSATAYQMQLFAGVDSTGAVVATDGVAGIYIWGASLTLATDAHLPYQRVNTATDYDADPAKFPAYLSIDGVDDAMATIGNVNLSSAQQLAVVSGYCVTKGTGTSLLAELTEVSITSGAFSLFVRQNDGACGWSIASPQLLPTSAARPLAENTVNTVYFDRGGASTAAIFKTLRLNGENITPNFIFSSQTPTFANDKLFLFARNNGTTHFMGGRFYGLVLRGGGMPQATLEAVERYMNSKVRAY